MDRHLRELDCSAAVSNNIVHLYKPVGTEDPSLEAVLQPLTSAGVPLLHMHVSLPMLTAAATVLQQHARAATACMRVSALLQSCGVSVVCQLHAAG